MSVNTGFLSDTQAKQPSSAQAKRQVEKWRYVSLFSPLWLCLLLALIVRIWIVRRSQGFIDGDEVLTGIQAQQILHGQLPVYFYGQPYMGSLEAYLIAPIFAIFGSSNWTLRIEPIILSLILVCLTWKFAHVLADSARLSAPTRLFFATAATSVAALPPLYDAIAQLHTWGGYIETFILMLLLLISTLRLTQRWQAGASHKELAWRWLGIGFVVGLGFWIYPLIISAVVASALWILGYTVLALYRNYRQHFQEIRRTPVLLFSPLKHLLLALVAIPSALLGFTPALIWGAQNNWANITYVMNLGGGITQRTGTITKAAQVYLKCVGPHVVSGALPRELHTVYLPLFLLGVSCIVGSFVLLLASFYWRSPLLVQARNLAALPLLFGIWTFISFTTGKNSASGVLQCDYDPIGRYATPLALVLPFFYATIFTIALQILIRFQTTLKLGDTIPSGLVQRFPGQLRAALMPALLFAVLLSSLAMQADTYQRTNMPRAFEPPFCHWAPVDDAPIVRYLESQHVRYAWSTNWIAYRIVFETHSQIIVADAMPFIPPVVNLDRIPANAVAVRHADRPALIVFVSQGDPRPPLLRALDAAGVTYKVARFSSVPGVDILVVTPLSRTVSPFESTAISSNFASCFY